jgi:intein-encoded DNA endonuclease-like protein
MKNMETRERKKERDRTVVWLMPDKDFKKMASEVTLSAEYLKLFSDGVHSLTEEERESLKEMTQKYGIILNSDLEIAEFSTDLNKRLFATTPH